VYWRGETRRTFMQTRFFPSIRHYGVFEINTHVTGPRRRFFFFSKTIYPIFSRFRVRACGLSTLYVNIRSSTRLSKREFCTRNFYVRPSRVFVIAAISSPSDDFTISRRVRFFSCFFFITFLVSEKRRTRDVVGRSARLVWRDARDSS